MNTASARPLTRGRSGRVPAYWTGRLALVLAAAVLALAPVDSPLSAESGSAGAMARHMLSSTAQVVVLPEGAGRRSGSSIVVASDPEEGRALLVTAAHVLAPAMTQEIHAVRPLRSGSAVRARLVARDEQADLAILEVEGFDAVPVRFSQEAALGDPVWVASFPWGGRATVVSGMVSQIEWDPSGPDAEVPVVGPVSLIDATVSHGMSGGGVFNRDSGELVGLVRSHRSVTVTLPGEPDRSITLPVAGETNVVSARKILCFLASAGYSELVPEGLLEGTCRAGS